MAANRVLSFFLLILRLVQIAVACYLLVAMFKLKVTNYFDVSCPGLPTFHLNYTVKIPFHRITFEAPADCSTNTSMSTISIKTGFAVPGILTMVLLIETIFLGIICMILTSNLQFIQRLTKASEIRKKSKEATFVTIMSIAWIVDLILSYLYWSSLKETSNPHYLIKHGIPICQNFAYCSVTSTEDFDRTPLIMFVLEILITILFVINAIKADVTIWKQWKDIKVGGERGDSDDTNHWRWYGWRQEDRLQT